MNYREYQDQEGFFHAVYLVYPDDPLETGLRVSLDWQPIAEAFQLNADVHKGLWERGVKTVGDYFVAGIHGKVVAALLTTIPNKHTAKSIAAQLISHVRNNYGNNL